MKRAPRLLWIIPALLLSAGVLKATLPQTMIGTWTSAASLSQPRSNASAVMLSDGRILIAGGDGGNGAIQSAELFDINGSVSSAAAMNVARSGHFAVVLNDGRVLVGGGNSSGGGTTNSAEIYDPSNDSWTQIHPLTSARAHATAALLQDGTVLIAGGDNSGAPSNTIEIFDPSNGNFNFAGTLSSPRTKHAMAVLQDGRVLIVGGSDGTNALASSEVFDPSTGNISAGPSLATPRYGHSATTLLDGRVAVIGGITIGQNGAVELASAEIYDPSAGSFSTAGGALATARQGHQAFLLPNNNNVLIVGGATGGTPNPQPVGTSEFYSAWQDAFIATGANVTPRSAAVGSTIKQDGLLLATGGSDASGNALASTELYAFPTVKTDASDYAPGTVVTITGSGWKPGEAVTLTLVESPLIDTHPQMTAVADANGNISNNQFSPDVHDINIRFYLTAVGSQSGLQAQNTFTDATATNATLVSSPNPSNVNQSVTLTATVRNGSVQGSGTLVTVGSVDFYDQTGIANPNCGGSTGIHLGTTQSVNGSGTASINFTFTSAGAFKLGACYNGTGGQGTQNSQTPSITQTVSGSTATTTTVTSSANPSTYGSLVTFTATVSPNTGSSTPTGSVQFVVDGSNLGSAVTLSGGTASTSTSTLTVNGGAPHTVTANYTHTGNFSDSSGTLAGGEVVNPATLTASIIGNPTKPYDGNATATLTSSNFSLSGLVGSDSFTVTKTSGTYNSKDVATANTVSATLAAADFTAGSGTLASNYGLPTTASGAGQITAVTLTAAIIGNPTKPYDGTTTATLAAANYVLTGLVGTETIAVSQTAGAYNSKDVVTAATVNATLANGNFTAGTGTLLTNYVLPTTASGPGHITAVTLTAAIIGNPTKPYDGNTSAALTSANFSLSGLVTGESITVMQTSGTYNSQDVVSANTVTASLGSGNFAAGGATLLSNYVLPNTASGAGQITPKTLIGAIIGNPTKTYDGNANATLTSANFSLSSLATGESFTVTKNSGTYNSKDVATATTITANLAPADFTAGSGTLASNYALPITASGPGQITTKAVTASIIGDPTKIYDGNTAATLTSANFSLSGLVGGESFTVTKTSGLYNSKDVPLATTVSASLSAGDFTPGAGTLASNYSLPTTAGGPGQITPRPLVVSAHGIDKQYDGTAVATVTLSDDRVSGDALTDSHTGATFTDKNVGMGKSVNVSGISISGPDAGDYTLSNITASTAANITQRPLTVSATGVNKIYDGTTTATVDLADDRVASDVFSDSYASAMFNNKNVGTGKAVSVTGISISGADAGNYTVSSTTTSTMADITARPLTITATGINKIYDGTTAATVTLADNRIAGDMFTGSYTSASFADKNVGIGKTVNVSGISISGADAGNYSFNTTASATADMTARPLTVSAMGVNKVYDGTTAATVIPSDDRVSGDSLTDNYASASFADKNVANNKPVSVSGISISGADSGNYALSNTTANASANITPRTLTVTATGVNKLYDGTATATVTLSDDRVAGDSLADSYTSASFADKSVGNAKIVSVSGISISGTDANNYMLGNVIANTIANITPRPLTVTAHGVDKQYDGTTMATVTLSDDRVAGDVFTDSYTSASFVDKNAGSGKSVNASGISISGTDAGNYSFNSTASTTASISQRLITVTAVTDTKVYDGNTTSAGVPTVSAPGIASGDTANFTQTFDSRNAGARTLLAAGSVNDGNGGNNYAVTFMNVNGTISPRPIAIAADPKTKVYGGVDPQLTYQTTSGSLAAMDSFTGSLTRVSGENVGGYSIQQGTLTLGTNYTLSYVGASLSITPATLTITPDGGKTKTLGAVFTAFTGTVNGLKFHDGVTVTYTSTGAPAAAAVGSYDITVSGYSFTTGMASNYAITLNKAVGGLQVLYSTAACLGDYGHQILQPINIDGTSVFKQKSTVPAKFRVCDSGGNSIGTPGVVSSFRLVQTMAGTVVNVVDESVDSTTPDINFRWDPTAQQWIFNMNTKSLTANVTYYYTIALNDGSTITFLFGLK